jgi:hypothetical protein
MPLRATSRSCPVDSPPNSSEASIVLRAADITIDLAIRLEVRYIRAPQAEQAGGGVQDKPVTRQSLDTVVVPAVVSKNPVGECQGFASLAPISRSH